jgi:PAS domain S-box-containing protein
MTDRSLPKKELLLAVDAGSGMKTGHNGDDRSPKTVLLRVLYVDDEPDLLEIGKIFLEQDGDFAVTTITNAPDALRLLEQETFDAIISDYQMPGMDGIQFLEEVRARFGRIPFVLFTGRGREEVVVQAINRGVDFYLQKGGDPRSQFAELAHKVRQAASRRKAEEQLRKSEEDYRHLIERSDEAIAILQDGLLRKVNQSVVRLTGYSEEELMSLPLSRVIHANDYAMVMERHGKRMTGEESPSQYSFRLVGKDGNTIWVEISTVSISWEGRPATINFLIDVTERTQAVEALRESEKRFHSYIDQAPDGIFIVDGTGRYLEVNPAACRMTGYGKDELLHMHIGDLFPPESREPATRHFKEVADTGHASGEFAFRRKDGTPRFWSVDAVRLSADRFIGFARDVTGRRQAENELRLTQARLESAMEAGTIAWWEMDCISGHVLFNERKARMLGYPAGQFSHYTDFTSLVHPDDYEPMMQMMRDHLAGIKKRYDVTYRIRTRSGEYLWTRDMGGISEYTGDGKPLKVAGLVIDVTELMQAKEALARQKEYLDRILNSIADPVFVKDEAHRRVLGNDAYCRFTGLSREEMINRSDHELYPPELADHFIGEDNRVFSEGSERVTEEEILDHKGEAHTIITKKTLLTDVDGKKFIVGIARDMTENKHTEMALHLANKKLNMLNRITRHDILNQLMTLRTFIDLTKAEVKDPVLQNYILQEEQAAEAIHGQIEFAGTYQDIGGEAPKWQILSETISSVRDQMNPQGVGIHAAVDRWEVFADPLMEKVFCNLIENSLRYGEHVTSLDFSVRETEHGLLLTYADNGVGIPAEDKGRLFRKEFGKHTGLGLFLSREILSITGITITETGEQGKGARFEITVPKGSYRPAGPVP